MPIVLMSAKGDKIRGKFVAQTGARDAITKPFDARGLIAVVESALSKEAQGSSNLADAADAPPSSESGERYANEAHRSIKSVSRCLGEAMFSKLGSSLSGIDSEEELVAAFEASLSTETLTELKETLIGEDLGGESEVLAGSLGAVSIAEVLQMLEMQQKDEEDFWT